MKNSPGTFQRVADVISGDMKGMEIMAFLDDVNVGTDSEAETLGSACYCLGSIFEGRGAIEAF